MRPMCTVVDGLPWKSTISSFLCLFPEMSVLRALDPVQTWLGQELEKCGIDAMIYTRYILSLLLHDSYDLQEQENDIFVGWEKGVFKRWGKGKKKSADLTLEEIKKQAAVQCLLSASDESSGIETLVDELCSKLKDLKFNRDEQSPTYKEEKSNKSSDASYRDCSQSPAGKNQAEMYYAAFPPLSEKPVCLQETATVWNKSKVCSSNSSTSSSTAPQTSTETPSPKDYNSENETIVINSNNDASSAVRGKNQKHKGKIEKKNKLSNGATGLCRIGRRKSNRKIRHRSWSSGSSEAGLSSSDNQGETKTKFSKVKSKIHEVRNKKRKSGQTIATKNDKKKNVYGSSSADSVKPLCKRVKRQVKECTWKEIENERNDILTEGKNETEFREEPLWYTEPITEYLVPHNSRSKLETTYLKRPDDLYDPSKEVEELSDFVHDLQLNNHNLHETYLSACTIIEGHFLEMPADINETSDPTETSNCSLEEEYYVEEVHCIEITTTRFYEVEIDQSMLDPGASDMMQDESHILNMIWQKHELESDFEAESCEVLNENFQGMSAIWTQSTASVSAEGVLVKEHSSLAQFWVPCSPSNSVDSDGESLRGDSPDIFSPFFNSTKLSTPMHANNHGLFEDSSYFTEFDMQCRNSGFSPPLERASYEIGDEESSTMNEFFQTQSRLRIWTKNSAFDENEQCSNISTRTCSPWSHSEENRSDTETYNNHLEDYNHLYAEAINYVAAEANAIFCDEDPCVTSGLFLQSSALEDETVFVTNKKSKLESLCGIQLEKGNGETSDESNNPTHGYSSGIIKDIWVNLAEGNPEKTEVPLLPLDVSTFICQDINATDETYEETNKAVQRSEYHLWEGQREIIEKKSLFQSDSLNIDVGDYTTPSKTWHGDCVKENSFILGGVYGEFQSFNGESEWAVVPPSQVKGSLLECATTDVTTGADGFMTSGNSFAPGHRQLWKPFSSFEENPPTKTHDRKNIILPSSILHENLLGASNVQVDESGVDCAFPPFELNSNFSQCLHVECTCEPGGFSAESPNFKTESLSSESDDEYRHPRVCGVERTQYRSIRISPRTHFRPISASDFSPGGGSESDFDSDKDEVAVSAVSEDVLEYPQDDLRPLEEDAENEGNFYGKSELESGKFLPRLQKSGMEKSAQTSLEDQEELCAMLLPDKQDHLGHFQIIESFQREVMANSKTDESTSNEMGSDPVSAGDQGEYPTLGVDIQGVNVLKEKQCWWQKALYSPLIPGSFCESHYMKFNEKGNEGDGNSEEILSDVWRPLSIEKTSACNEARLTIDYGIGTKNTRKKIYSDSSSSNTASDGSHEWTDICREELFSRTQL